jgi:hypothetical protein
VVRSSTAASHPTRGRLGVALIGASLILSPALAHAQDKLTDASAWATALAGCYRLARDVAESIGLPDTIRLGTRPVRALGYHRLLFFHTSLAITRRHAETPPIWSPEAPDSVTIELAPRCTGGASELYLSFAVRGDTIAGHLEERVWGGSDMDPSGPPTSVVVARLPLRGMREPCSP